MSNVEKMCWKKLLNPNRLGGKPEKSEEGRSAFDSDHDKIVFSYAFRRLAKKTQVHPLVSNDHVHNRLIHSLEVSRVGRSIAGKVGECLKKSNRLPDKISSADFGNIVQVSCLAHDIGNPPFGHAGEEAIRCFFKGKGKIFLEDLPEKYKKDLENFEGNAQGFRVLTSNFGGEALSLTYAALGAFIKYPWASDLLGDEKQPKANKYGVFQSDIDSFNEVAEAVGLLREEGASHQVFYRRHPLVHIMEIADDFCYGLLDLEDGLEMGVVSWDDIEDVLGPILLDLDDTAKYRLAACADEKEKPKIIRGHVINKYVNSASDAFIKNESEILSGGVKELLDLCPDDVRGSVDKAKDLAKRKVFSHPRKVELEIGAYNTIAILMEVLCEAAKEAVSGDGKGTRGATVKRLLGEKAFEFSESISEEEKLYMAYMKVIDFISGMTDDYAVYLARQFGGFGSTSR